MSNMFDLSGRVAIVSGTAQGMGRAMATVFAEHGADLMLLDINDTGNEETAHTLSQMGRKAIPLHCDVSKYADVDKLYATLDKEFGARRYFGQRGRQRRTGRRRRDHMETFEGVFQSLVFGRYYSTQQAGRRMLKQGKGSIMSIGSIAGVSSLARQQSAYGMAMARSFI